MCQHGHININFMPKHSVCAAVRFEVEAGCVVLMVVVIVEKSWSKVTLPCLFD